MTDNEIKKALECCSIEHKCNGCPAVGIGAFCVNGIIKQAYDLINRQKAKIEALQMDNEQLQSDVANANMNLEHMTAEIEKLQEQVNLWQEEADSVGCANEWLRAHLKNAEAEAIKECFEWVLSLFPEDKNFTTISRFAVNRKLKEMVGDTE